MAPLCIDFERNRPFLGAPDSLAAFIALRSGIGWNGRPDYPPLLALWARYLAGEFGAPWARHLMAKLRGA
jgi:hypothetical protein